MTSYKELLEQRAQLEQQINAAREAELAAAVSKVRALIAEYDLGAEDVFPPARASSGKAGPKSGSKVAPKYRNPETNETWTGRGKAPKWIQDQDRDKFLIA